MIDLKAIKARAAAASPGPWVVMDIQVFDGEAPEVDGIYTSTGERIVETDSGVYEPRRPDADFIAHAREDIPALLAELERLAALIDALNMARS